MRKSSASSVFALLLLVLHGSQTAGAKSPKKDNSKKQEAVAAASAKDPNALDLDMVTRIRQEAFRDSKVMETLEELTDHIGPRLTNSPNVRKANAWTRDQLTKWGMENAHLEPWGPFGRGWSYEVSTVRMTAPDTAELIALPKAFTPGTDGPVHGKVIRAKLERKEDLDKWRGKLKGQIVLIGDMRKLSVNDKPASERYDDATLAHDSLYEMPPPPNPDRSALVHRFQFAKELTRFLEEEKPAAVIEPSRPPGEGGTIFVQAGGSYKPGDPVGAPSLVMDPEQYNRMWRLLDHNIDVELEVNVKTHFYDDDLYGYNTIAEIEGTDPLLKAETVMLGAHLDSWHGGTGATDNAAGCAVMMEVMRIMKALDVKPRRTIRIALWTGEEQGLFGSRGYVKEHFGTRAPSTDPAEKDLPEYMQRHKGEVTPKPEHEKLSAYYNFDEGTGKIRGVFLQENAAVAPIFREWMEPFRDLGMTTLTMRNTGGSDFISFDEVGLPGFGFIQDPVEYDSRTHHSNMDVYDRVQREDLMQASAIIATFVYQSAMRDQKIPRKPMPKAEKAEPKQEAVPTGAPKL